MGESDAGPAEAPNRAALDAAAGGLGRAPAPRRQARRPGARGAAAEAQPRGQVHARRLGLPGRRGRPRGRRGRGRLSRPARCASSRRRPGSSWPRRRSWCCSRAGSRPRCLDAASTPGSSSPWRPPTRRPSPTGSRPSTPRWFEPRAALEAQAAGELALAFPTIKQLESLLAFATSEEALAAYRGRTVEPVLPKVIEHGEAHRVVLPGDPATTPRPERRADWTHASATSRERRQARRARGRAGRCGCRSRPSPPAAA